MKLAPFFLLLLPFSCLAQSTNPPVNVYIFGSGTTNVPPDLIDATAVAAARYGAIALRADGTVVALNDYSYAVPPGLTNVTAIAAGGPAGSGNDTFLALKADGTVVGWGWQGRSLSNVVQIAGSSGGNAYLALMADGTVFGWGGVPGADVPAGGISDVVSLAAGNYESLALKLDGTVVGWSGGSWAADVPPGLSNVMAIAAASGAFNHSTYVALQTNGTLVSWGSQPVSARTDLTNAVALAAGLGYALVVKADGTVVGCGPVQVPPDLPYTLAVSVGPIWTVALTDPTNGFPPIITQQPIPNSQVTTIGSSVSIFARAAGFGPLTYQWFFGTNAIPGATGPVLTLTNLHEWQSGSYSMVVSNAVGFVWSQPAILQVLPDLVGIDMVPRVAIQGEIGYTYNLQYIYLPAPTNAWQTLATLTITNQPQYYYDVSGIRQPTRFYRLVQVP